MYSTQVFLLALKNIRFVCNTVRVTGEENGYDFFENSDNEQSLFRCFSRPRGKRVTSRDVLDSPLQHVIIQCNRRSYLEGHNLKVKFEFGSCRTILGGRVGSSSSNSSSSRCPDPVFRVCTHRRLQICHIPWNPGLINHRALWAAISASKRRVALLRGITPHPAGGGGCGAGRRGAGCGFTGQGSSHPPPLPARFVSLY